MLPVCLPPMTLTSYRSTAKSCLSLTDSLATSGSFSPSPSRGAKRSATRLHSQIVTNEHAPDRERAQTVRNIDPWYEAYAVKPGQKLYLKPEERVRIW